MVSECISIGFAILESLNVGKMKKIKMYIHSFFHQQILPFIFYLAKIIETIEFNTNVLNSIVSIPMY